MSIKLLDRYKIDRSQGMTVTGPERLVILVLKPNDGPEISFAISKMDAMLISIKLSEAAAEVQEEKLRVDG
jgi:hypothetical protein